MLHDVKRIVKLVFNVGKLLNVNKLYPEIMKMIK